MVIIPEIKDPAKPHIIKSAAKLKIIIIANNIQYDLFMLK